MSVSARINPKNWTREQYNALLELGSWVDFLLGKPLEILSGEETFDPGTINAGTVYSRTLSVPGTRAGVPVFLGWPDSSSTAVQIAGAYWFVPVSWTREGELDLSIRNISGGNVTPGEITYRYMIFNVFPRVAVGA